jgi:hypothetical protein
MRQRVIWWIVTNVSDDPVSSIFRIVKVIMVTHYWSSFRHEKPIAVQVLKKFPMELECPGSKIRSLDPSPGRLSVAVPSHLLPFGLH